MADKPSKGLVVYGDGLARFIDESHIHLHSLASRGFCGFLSLPYPPPSESEDARIVREFAQLVDVCEASPNLSGEDIAELEYQKCLIPSISERFMGMKSAMITNNSRLKSFGSKLGFTVLRLSDLIDDSHPIAESPLDVLASELLKLLGFQEGKTSETSPFDLVFIHIGDGEKNGKKDIKNVNDLMGGIMNIAKPGNEVGCRLHMSLVISYGAISKDDDPSLSVLISKDEDNSDLSLLFPHQSYTMKGRNLRNNIRHHCPMLISQWQDAVTRKDMAEAFSFKDFKENGGILTIPADRFIHEVAFKLWKAPKYGA